MNDLIDSKCDQKHKIDSYRKPRNSNLCRLCLDIMTQYNSFDSESKQRNLTAWRPVVAVILTAFSKFNDDQFALHIQKIYPSTIKLLLNDITPDLRIAIYNILLRSGKIAKFVTGDDTQIAIVKPETTTNIESETIQPEN